MPTKTTGATPKRTTTRKSPAGTKSGSKMSKRSGNGRSGTHMVASLEESFLAELGDMLYAGREVQKVLPKLAQSTTSRRLRDVLEWQSELKEEQVERLEEVFKVFNRKPETEVCEGMQGILAECKDLVQKTGPGPVRDAMIIAATQKAAHYEISSYGTLCSWAEHLGEDHAVRLLEESLHEQKSTDRNLTRIAESFANPQADRFGREERGRGSFSDEQRFSGNRQQDDDGRGRTSGREKRYSE